MKIGKITACIWLFMVSNLVLANEQNYYASKYDPIHFKPAITQATDAQCLSCHQEILNKKIRPVSPAGVDAKGVLAWYQTLDTYTGEQDTFHRRHLVTDYAKKVMNLKCNTCHQGNDPREETSKSSATTDTQLTQRKMVNPKTCQMCHGKFGWEKMLGLSGPWTQVREIFQNNCLLCHATIRSNRHQVNFLNAQAIEEEGAKSGDSCYGCHGGRAWYRTSHPYPRHAWPTMSPETPDWAKDRPTESEPRFLTHTKDAAR